jgi:hypothetical protein
MAGQYGPRAALSGLGNVAKLALNPAVQGIGAIGYGLGKSQQGVLEAPGGERLKEALYDENLMLGAMAPDLAFGAAITDAAKIKEKQAAASNPGARVDDRTKRDPRNYGPAPAAPTTPEESQRETQSLLNRYPAPEAKKEIIAAAKDAVPESKETKGWSGDDWLQFGLSLMGGQSQYALQNVSKAGMDVLASRAEREKEKNKTELYKSIYANKPGPILEIADLIMAADSKLTLEQALEKATQLTGGSTKQDLADARAEGVLANKIKNYQAAVEKINNSLIGMRASAEKATPEAKKAYQDAIAALGPNPALGGMQQPAQTTAPAIPPPGSPIKVLGVRPAP